MFSRIGSLYCLTCGLVVGPALFTVALAVALGWLPDRPLDRVVSALTDQAVEAKPAPEAEFAATPKRVGHESTPDTRLWSRRLEEVGDGIERDLERVESEFARLEKERAQLSEVSRILTQVLSQLLGEEITRETLLSSAEQLVEKLEKSHAEAERRPWLLETLQSMGPRDVAGVLSGVTAPGDKGMNEEEAVALLGGLPPRKAGQVLAELGKVDPVRAARMLAQVGRDEDPTRGSLSGGKSP